MVIRCKKCGHDNPLGRVFCGQCGNKLDLTMSSEELNELERSSWLWTCGKYVIILVILAIVVAAGLALWPAGAFATGGKQSDAHKVVNQTRGLRHIMDSGYSGSVYFSEEELNAYLYHWMRKPMAVDSMSVSVRPGVFVLRVVRSFRAIGQGSLGFKPKYSYEVTICPDQSTRKIQRAAIGHLPLVGPVKNLVSRRLIDQLVTQGKDRVFFDKRTSITAEAGRLTMSVQGAK